MSAVGVAAPRVVVRPPSLPAAPPISLLTQGTTEETDSSVVGEGAGRWYAGGGTAWWEPLRQFSSQQVWQQWPGTGTDQASKRVTSAGGSAAAVDRGLGTDERSPTQQPMIAVVEVQQGLLAELAVRDEGSTFEAQMAALMAAILPRVVERELWTADEAVLAGWTTQFRLKGSTTSAAPYGNTAIPYRRALALAEKAAADYRFRDLYGGAFIHMSPALFELITSPAELNRAPSGRQVRTLQGSQLIPEVGGNGKWTESAQATIRSAKPAGGIDGDDLANGWLFVTPPVRIRLAPPIITNARDHSLVDTNDALYLVEQPFVLEATVDSSHPTSIGIPVDYTQGG